MYLFAYKVTEKTTKSIQQQKQYQQLKPKEKLKNTTKHS